MWKKAIKPYEVQWQPDYEPYIITSVNITQYDTHFVGRNFNKISHIEELHYQHYKFIVLPDGFLLHIPHDLSKDAAKGK